MAKCEDLEIHQRIDKEKRKLNQLFTKIDNKTKKAVQSLIENAAFMAITLADLSDTINQNGCISEYQNGENQWGTKKAPEVEVYNSMIKNYSSIIKQLTDLIPKEPPQEKDKGDGFEEFVNSR